MWAERSEERTLVLGTCLTQLEKPYAKRRKKDVGKLKNDKDFISMKFRGFVAQMDYFLKNMHDMTDAEIQRRSNAFMRDYDDIRAEIDEIGIEMD